MIDAYPLWRIRWERGSHYTPHYSSLRQFASCEEPRGTHLKIDVAVLVHVECAEHVVAEFFRVAGREEHFIHVDKFRRR